MNTRILLAVASLGLLLSACHFSLPDLPPPRANVSFTPAPQEATALGWTWSIDGVSHAGREASFPEDEEDGTCAAPPGASTGCELGETELIIPWGEWTLSFEPAPATADPLGIGWVGATPADEVTAAFTQDFVINHETGEGGVSIAVELRRPHVLTGTLVTSGAGEPATVTIEDLAGDGDIGFAADFTVAGLTADCVAAGNSFVFLFGLPDALDVSGTPQTVPLEYTGDQADPRFLNDNVTCELAGFDNDNRPLILSID